jgi:hypothetical protein
MNDGEIREDVTSSGRGPAFACSAMGNLNQDRRSLNRAGSHVHHLLNNALFEHHLSLSKIS